MEKKTVLIVDDQETTIAALKKILREEYEIYTSLSGADGIKAAEKHLPDVILLDILMLEMDGYAVISALKKSCITKDIPVIFISALSSDANEERGLALGAADYITKPFSPAIVKLRLRNQIKMLDQLRTIEKLGMIDQLTELPNRRSFENRMNSEWARALREQTPISLLIIDLDRFKNYNDTYGHLQGDVALQVFAKFFASTLKRPTDFIARWGGEEFIAILPNTDMHGASEMAEQIRKCAENIIIPGHESEPVCLSVSIGVNSFSPAAFERSQYGTINEFMSKADKALYNAKNLGRNRVCIFE